MTDFEAPKQSYNLLLSQAVCSLLFHLTVYQKLQRSIEKMIFLYQNPKRFSPIVQPFLIAHMQLFIQFLTQLVVMYIMSRQKDPSFVVMNFVSFLFIAQLDEIYYNFVNSPLKDKLQTEDFIVEADAEY